MARAQALRTHCPRGHAYTPENTNRSNGRRHCRQCQKDRHARTYVPKVERTLAEKLWAHFEKHESGCWLWTGPIAVSGYGTFRGALAHRLMYELLVGPIPEGLTLDHVKARGCHHLNCVNPSHLEPVTNAVNILRSDSPTAINARKTHCPQGHPYDEENTYVNPTSGHRMCRTCNRERGRR